MSDQERRELREFNGHMIEDLCELGEAVVDQYAAEIRRLSGKPVVHNYLPEGWTQARWDQALAEHRKHGEE